MEKPEYSEVAEQVYLMLQSLPNEFRFEVKTFHRINEFGIFFRSKEGEEVFLGVYQIMPNYRNNLMFSVRPTQWDLDHDDSLNKIYQNFIILNLVRSFGSYFEEGSSIEDESGGKNIPDREYVQKFRVYLDYVSMRITQDELAKKYYVSRKTIQRYIKEVKEWLSKR